jgi:hypothetical protein
MNKHAGLRRKLRAAITSQSILAADKAISGADIEEDLKQLEVYQKLLSALPERRYIEIYIAAIVAAVCLLAASFAWTWRVASAKIHLGVTTTAASMQLFGPLNWSEAGLALVQLGNFSRLTLPQGLGIPEQVKDLEISGGRIKLRQLSVKPGAQVKIWQEAPGEIEVLVSGQPLDGVLEISGQLNLKARSNNGELKLDTPTFEVPEVVRFGSDGHSVIPSRIRLDLGEAIQLHDIQVRDLSLFIEKATETSGGRQVLSFVSAINKGELTVLATGEGVELRPGVPLRLEGNAGALSDLELSPDGLRIAYDGEVHGLSLGSPAFARNLMPTWLDYLVHEQRLGFFWSAVVFLWGLIWGGRRLLQL